MAPETSPKSRLATIVDVVFISDERAAVKAECGDHIGYEIVDYETGMRVEAELARERAHVLEKS